MNKKVVGKALIIGLLGCASPVLAQQAAPLPRVAAPVVSAPAAVPSPTAQTAAPSTQAGVLPQYSVSPQAMAALPQLKILKASYSIAQFHPPQKEEEKLVRSLFAAYLKDNPAMRLSTALFDIDGNGTGMASIAIRFNSPSTCRGTGAAERCYTTVLRMVSGHWLIAMNRTVATLETETLASRDARQKEDSMLIRSDGREVWESTPGGVYHATSWGVGEPLVGTALPVLPTGFSLPGGPASWTVDTTETMMVLQSKFCDESDCRIMVLVPGQPGTSLAANAWRVVMDTVVVGGRAALGTPTAGGMRDILVDSGMGYDTWRWDTKSVRYGKAETSYASPLTAAP